MRSRDAIIEEDLKIMVGAGATMCVGSDQYPYYISETLPNNVIGLYEPESYFDQTHPWEKGERVVEKFDASHKSTIFIKRCYGNWWVVDPTGKKRIRKFSGKYNKLWIGEASSYLDPSF